jgi:hypothetical protein
VRCGQEDLGQRGHAVSERAGDHLLFVVWSSSWARECLRRRRRPSFALSGVGRRRA